jgi:hypothetical protein
MDENAFVTWLEHPRPWECEKELLGSLVLPLNLEHNRTCRFFETLTALRSEMRRQARALPIA